MRQIAEKRTNWLTWKSSQLAENRPKIVNIIAEEDEFLTLRQTINSAKVDEFDIGLIWPNRQATIIRPTA